MEDKEFEVKADVFLKKLKDKNESETETIIIDTDKELYEDTKVKEKVLLIKDGRQLLM